MHMRQDQGGAKEGGRTEPKKPKRRKVKLHTSSHSCNARKMAKHDLQPNKPDRERKKERKKYHHSPSPGSTRKPHTHTHSLPPSLPPSLPLSLSLSLYLWFISGTFPLIPCPCICPWCSRHGKSCQ